MSDPAPPCARRGMAVRVPPRGHRVLTYPALPQRRRRVSTVCVPPIWHRVMSDLAPPCARRGMAVRVPPRGHRVLTYPALPQRRRRVSTVCVPWRTPPSPCRPASTGCARRACPTPLPIPAPSPTCTPTKTLSTPTPGTAALPGTTKQSRASRNSDLRLELPFPSGEGLGLGGKRHHPPSASCHPSTAPPAALLHRVYGLPAQPPLPRAPPPLLPRPIARRPKTSRKPTRVPCFHPSPLGGEGPGVRPNAPRPPSSPSLEGGGQGVGPPITPSLSLGDGAGAGG